MAEARFGHMIRSARRDAHITLQEAGNLIGVTPVYISEVELSKRPPFSIPRIRALAKIYGVNDSYLIEQAISERGFFEIHANSASSVQLRVLSGMARGELNDEQWQKISRIIEQGRESSCDDDTDGN